MESNSHVTRRQVLAALGASALCSSFSVLAQSDRPISLILPVGAGSGVDTIIRSAGPAWSQALKHTLVIENKPGAGGIVGTSALIKAPADGYTLGVVSNNHVIYPSVYKSVPFDPIADITPISVIGSTPFLLVVNPKKLPVSSVQELIALLKKNPGDYNFASSGNGTVLHLATEMFVDQAGVQARHIPYKGVGPMLTDIIGGQVDFGISSLPSLQAHLKGDGLRALGVCGKSRIAALPDMPTIAEQGLPNYDIEGWFAVIAPARLPDEKVQEVFASVSAAFTDPKVKQSMAAQGNTIRLMPPAETARYFRSELAKYATIVKNAGMEPI
jgi:tripartite-type tricarboxylate transporter receptor subunit TctC